MSCTRRKIQNSWQKILRFERFPMHLILLSVEGKKAVIRDGRRSTSSLKSLKHEIFLSLPCNSNNGVCRNMLSIMGMLNHLC